MKKYLTLLLGALFLTACSEQSLTESPAVDTTDTTEDAAESTSDILRTDRSVKLFVSSPKVTSIDIYADEDCSEPIATNVAIADSQTVVTFTVASNVEEVYVQYPTSGGFDRTPVDTRMEHWHWMKTKSGNYAWMQHYTCGKKVNDPKCYFSFTIEKPTTPPSCYSGQCCCGPDCTCSGHSGGESGGDSGESGGDSGESGGDSGESGGDSGETGDVVTGITLPEDVVEGYTTEHAYTSYHSTGVVFFDSGWPNTNTLEATSDLNDLVLDYDLESNVLDASREDFAANDWREGLKVVIHVRAIGNTNVSEAGLKLEGLSASDFVKTSEVALTLGNYDPIPANSLEASLETDGDCPVIRIKNLQWLLSQEAKDAGINLNSDEVTLYNTERRSKAEWLESGRDLMNHGTSLFTVTVRLKGTLRSTMTDSELSAAQVEAYTKAAMTTTDQNFFLVTTDGKEIHLAGYSPLQTYTSAYTATAASGSVTMASATTYRAAAGQVWGVKVPVLTKHIYEGESFSATFPQWAEWLSSDGATYNGTWYLPENSDEDNWVKWW